MGKLSQDIIDRIPALYEQLGTKKAVAEELGISTATVSKYLLLNELPQEAVVQEKKRRHVTPEDIENFNRIYSEVGSVCATAKIVNFSPPTVKRYLNEENLKKVEEYYNDRDALFYYIVRLFGVYNEKQPVSDVNLILMSRYHNQGMPMKGQLMALKYYYEITRHKVKKEYQTIGIVKYIWNDALYYYKTKEKEKERMLQQIKKQFEKDRVEIPYNPGDYFKKAKKRKKKKIDFKSLEG